MRSSSSDRRLSGRPAVVVASLLSVMCLASSCALPLLSTATGRASGADPSSGTNRRCALPSGSAPFGEAAPSEVDLDAEALGAAVDYATRRGAQSLRVYRRGCLVARSGLDPLTENQRLTGWSMSKGVVGAVVGRAEALGLLGLDDPIGEHLPGLATDKAAITVRQLLTQTSGLRFAWVNDLWAAGTADSVGLTLQRPFEAEPGSTFLYAQTAVSVLVAVVQAAVGRDFQEFASSELFEPVGIVRSDWEWERDAVGNTQGFAFLQMTPLAWSRIGVLLQSGGTWAGRQLIDRDFIAQGVEGTAANPGYGFLWRTNAGDWHVKSDPSHERVESEAWPGLPRDAFAFSGLFDQHVEMIPSLEMVVVRLGPPPELFGDPLGESDGLRPSYTWRFHRLLMASVQDVDVPDPGPWVYPGPNADLVGERIIDLNLPPFAPGG